MRHDGKSKLKGKGFGFLDKGMDLCASFGHPIIRYSSTCAINMDWGRIPSLVFYGNFKTWK